MTNQKTKLRQTPMLRWLWRGWPWLAITGIVIVFFWPLLIGVKIVGFRDTLSFYWPLFQWIDREWALGELPLWNPYDGLGQPVVGEGVTSVFYPGKLIFLFREFSFSSRFGMYIGAHVWLAFAGAYVFARSLKGTRGGAFLSGICFAFSGPFLFQATNVVYLVGAAWLPWGLRSIWLGRIENSFKHAKWTGIFAALMILGGDPQMAYHLCLLAAVTWIWPRAVSRDGPVQTFWNRIVLSLRTGLAMTAVCGIVTVGLAAIQILPSYSAAQLSERVDFDLPRSLYEGIRWTSEFGVESLPQTGRGIFGPPVENTHHADIYQFSQPPWSLIELIWPNISGKPFPQLSHWASGLPGAERVWQPSLYQGMGCLLLAWIVLRHAVRPSHRWLRNIAVTFCIGSFGWYGCVWLLNEIGLATAVGKMDPAVGPQVGGLYWLMVTALPGYVNFRFPAKLFVVATLTISVLAGTQLGKRMLLGQMYRSSLTVGILSLVGWLLTIAFDMRVYLPNEFADAWFGPFQSDLAISGIRGAFLHAFLCCIVICMWSRMPRTTNRKAHDFSFVMIVMVDILLANSWVVPAIPTPSVGEIAETTFGQPLAPSQIDSDTTTILKSELRLPRRFLTVGGQQLPGTWSTTSSSDRLSEIESWQNVSLYPRTHLLYPTGQIGFVSALKPRHWSWIEEALANWVAQAPTDEPNDEVNAVSLREFLGLAKTDASNDLLNLNDIPFAEYEWHALNTEKIHAPSDNSHKPTSRRSTQKGNVGQSFAIYNPVSATIRNNTLGGKQEYRIAFWEDFLTGAVHYEKADPNEDPLSIVRDRVIPRISHVGTTISFSSSRITAEVVMEEDGVFVIRESFADGWKVKITERQTGEVKYRPSVKTGGVFRGVGLPKGKYFVDFYYLPNDFLSGVAMTITTVIGLLVSTMQQRFSQNLLYFRRKTRHSPNTQSIRIC